jgi:predicted  nucleic acid-binding Zn-ribbon protein
MARFNITLPNALKDRLKEEADQQKKKPSSLIAQYVEEHYTSTSNAEYEELLKALKTEYTAATADYKEQISILQAKCEATEQQAETEVETLTKLQQHEKDNAAQTAALQDAQIKELQNKLESAKTDTKNLESDIANRDEEIQQLERDIQRLEQGMKDFVDKTTQEKASQETVITGLQHELERVQDNTKRLEEQVVDLKAQIRQANDEKQNLYKQLELVTLRLPAPRVSFWARVFGRKKKEQEGQA